MTFSAFDQTKDQIMNDVLYILDHIRKDRSFLNKHFQNSINNYFLEDYAGNFLKDFLNMPRAKDITKYVQYKYMDLKGTKYMKLMYGYIQELKEANQINQFKNLLLANMQSESYDNDKNSKEWQSNVWKKAFSLFVHHFCQKDNDELKGIFEIWNSLFPRTKILRKRQENVNHRPREFQEQEINNVRTCKSQNPNQNQEIPFQYTASEQQAIQNLNQTLFGNDFKTGVFYPNQKNQYHLKQQFDYCLFPQQQQVQQQQQSNVFYSNQTQIQSKSVDNQIYDDQVEINFDLPQQQDNINDFFTNIPEDFLNKSDTSSPLSSAPQTMNNFNQLEQQQDQVNEQQVQQQNTLSRANSYKFLQQFNQTQISQSFGENQFNMFQDNEENDYQNPQFFCNFNNQENNNYLDLSQSYYFNQSLYQQNYA